MFAVSADPSLFVQSPDSSVSEFALGGSGGNQVLASRAIAAGKTNPGWDLVAVVDLNLDGTADLVWTDPNGHLIIWYMPGMLHTKPLGVPEELTGWRVAGFADFNHDGHPDLVLQNPSSGQFMVRYLTGNDGSTLLASASFAGLPGWRIAAIADFNGDGNPDLLWQNDRTHAALVWHLNPAGQPIESVSIPGAEESGSMIAGVQDLDRDGHPDAVWANGVVWYLRGETFLRPDSIQGAGAGGRLIVPASPSGTVAVLDPAPLASWNGINYSPRYHSYFRMLKDWSDYDSRLGGFVYQAADRDLDLLSANGYNLLHLYLWDKRLLADAVLDRWCPVNPLTQKRPEACKPPYTEPAGFPDFPNSPTSTAEGAAQFAALQDLVSRAEQHGLYVALHFASGALLDRVSRVEDPSTCETVAGEFGSWAGQFIAALTPVHRNVLLWGVAFAFGADGNGPTDLTGNANSYNRCFGRVYQTVDQISRAHAPPGQAGVLGLIGVNPPFELVTPPGVTPGSQFARPPNGYSWDVATTQRVARTMTDELTALYGQPKSPDVYMFSFYNPNAGDLSRNVDTLTHSNEGDRTRMAIPADRIFSIEFATSSSGPQADSWGDSETPTTSVDGQNEWLKNTLCAFRALGIRKSAYWAMYDPTSLWANAPWFNMGQQLAWNGYWGLGFEQPVDSVNPEFKPAWTTLGLYNRSPGALMCGTAPAPNLNAWALSDYITVGQSPKIVWTATETTSMLLDGKATGNSWACDGSSAYVPAPPISGALSGSCAFTFGAPASVAGDRTYTLTAYNGTQESRTEIKVKVGFAPVILQSPARVGLNQVLAISGKGFAITPVNYLRWTRPGYADVYMHQGDAGGHAFSQDAFHITTVVDSRIARGVWTVYVYNNQSPAPGLAGQIEVY